MHEIASWTFGKLSDMEVDINESRSIKKIVEDLICKYTKIKKTELKDLMVRDSYFSSQEALKLGMVDCIVSKPQDLYGKINL